MFDKRKVNLVIDALMFLCLMAIAGIGLLIKFVLIPGKDRWGKYGRNVDLRFLQMDRHEWGTIHLVCGLVLLSLLVLHIALHWRQIVGIYRILVRGKMTRRIIAVIFVAICVALALFPFIVKTEVTELGQGEGHHQMRRYHGEETGKRISE